MRLYLNGPIRQWYSRGDSKGVVFMLDCKDVAEAHAVMDGLPLSAEKPDGSSVHSHRSASAPGHLLGGAPQQT